NGCTGRRELDSRPASARHQPKHPAFRLSLGLQGRRGRLDRQCLDRRPALHAARDNLGDVDTVSHQDGPGRRQRGDIGAAPQVRVSQRGGAIRGQRQRSSPGDRLDPRVVRRHHRGPSPRLPGPIGRQMPSITSFNITHLHLLLNHVPTVGSIVALGLLLLAFVRQNEHLKLAGLEVLFVIAVVTLPAYMSGVGAHQKLRDRPGISDEAIKVHQDAALDGFTVTEFAGFVAWVALWQFRRGGRAVPGLVPAAMLLSIVALALMARAATLGGDIRHPEIRADLSADAEADVVPFATPDAAPSADASERFVATRISMYMVNSPWAWPAAETVHFLGLSLSFGVVLAGDLRILGVMGRG